ncbi:MAG: cytidine/deoxycytidylate deaminase family protein [Firmicutes bacterium]|nr:cytidine/deoxycytidylate deaminase family protein [Bacillota bacterium]
MDTKNSSQKQGFDPKWDARFMQVANIVGSWSSCYQQNRQVGAVITVDKRIVATGYNGASVGIENCKQRNTCMRKDLNIKSGTMQELCYATHAEQNAIVQAARMGISIGGGTLYCTHQPCTICAKLIINSGIKRVVFEKGYPDEFSTQLFSQAGVEVLQVKI